MNILNGAVECLLAWALADLLSGLYHLATDRGWNIRSQVDRFQFHHAHPSQLGFDLSPMAAGMPFLALAWFWHPVFFVTLCIGVSVIQVNHYYAHHRAPRFVRLLQRLRIVLPPRHHAAHHRGAFDRNYCILSGWNNFWLNRILGRAAR